MDQFIATFHRFCGEDQTFFVATMTSRPIGLETAFSIQLADKQPVLRGMCVVLDAWETSDNRYKRPGIRLGIKRLTADSQIVFDRLRAASRSPAALVEGTPAPGPPPAPLPTIPSTATARPPAFSLRSATPPPLPSLIMPRTGSSIRATTATPPHALRPPAIVVRQGVALDLPAPTTRAPEARPARPTDVATRGVGSTPAEPKPVETDAVEPKPVATRPVATRPVAATPVATKPVATKPAVAAKPAEATPVERVAVKPAEATPVERVAAKPDLTPAEPEALGARPADANPADPEPADITPTAAPIEVTRFQVALNVAAEPPPVDDVEFRPVQLAPRPRLEPRIGDGTPDEPPVELGDPALIVDRPGDELPRAAAAAIGPGSQLASEPRPIDPSPAAALRTPGSSLVLPANPLHDLSDESLVGFVDCTLYEESGSVFHPASDGEWSDELADPPAPPPRTGSPGPVPAMPFDTAPNLTVRSLGNTESLALAGEAAAPGATELSPAHALPIDEEVPPAMTSYQGPGFMPPDAMRADHDAPAPALLAPGRALSSWQRWLVIGGTALAAIVVAFSLARLVTRSRPAGPTAPAEGAAAKGTTDTPGAARPPASPGNPVGPTTTAGRNDSAAAASSAPPVKPSSGSLPDDDAAAGGAPVVGSGPCRLTIATTPAGSIIRLDEVAVGPSPLTIASTCDKHKIDVSHARYQRQTRWVTLAPDRPQELDVTLARPIHAVTVSSFPPGAQLSIEGRRAGTTPMVVQMMGFATVNLTFTKPGFQSVTKKVYSKVRKDRVFVKLMK